MLLNLSVNCPQRGGDRTRKVTGINVTLAEAISSSSITAPLPANNINLSRKHAKQLYHALVWYFRSGASHFLK